MSSTLYFPQTEDEIWVKAEECNEDIWVATLSPPPGPVLTIDKQSTTDGHSNEIYSFSDF